MTFVATFAVHDVPAVIGDILISGPERREGVTTLPVIGPATRVFPKGSGWSIVDLRQKVTIVAPHCAIGWAGSRVAASVVIKDLIELGSRGELVYETIESYLLSLPDDISKHNLSIVGWVRNGSGLHRFYYGAESLTAPWLGRIHAAGTGTAVLCQGAAGLSVQHLPIGKATNALEQVMATWLSIVGMMLQAELHTQENLLHYYGGGYEIAALTNHGFRKLGNATFVLWLVDASAEEMHFTPKAVIKQTYDRDILLIRSVRLFEPDKKVEFENFEESLLAVPPAHRSVYPSELENIALPPLDSTWSCHVGIIQTATPPTVFTRTEYHPVGGPASCRFTVENGQFRFTMSKDLLDRFTKTIRANSTTN